jgi:hypothetical protein
MEIYRKSIGVARAALSVSAGVGAGVGVGVGVGSMMSFLRYGHAPRHRGGEEGFLT